MLRCKPCSNPKGAALLQSEAKVPVEDVLRQPGLHAPVAHQRPVCCIRAVDEAWPVGLELHGHERVAEMHERRCAVFAATDEKAEFIAAAQQETGDVAVAVRLVAAALDAVACGRETLHFQRHLLR